MRTTFCDEPCDAHVNELRHFALHQGFAIVKEFKDTPRHENTPRPELDALLADVQRKQFEVVLVWQCHLIARSIPHFIELLQTLTEHGTAFISVRDNFETSAPLGQAVAAIVSAARELERNLAAERVRAGLRRVRSAGRQLGRRRLIIDPASLQRDRARGLSLAQLARLHGISRTTVARALKRAADSSSSAVKLYESRSENPANKKP